MASFTTGKWKAFYGEEFHTVRQAHADDADGHDYGNGQIIAHIVQWHDGHDWANARLIAEAPQMFELLSSMCNYISEVEHLLPKFPDALSIFAENGKELLARIDGKEKNNA